MRVFEGISEASSSGVYASLSPGDVMTLDSSLSMDENTGITVASPLSELDVVWSCEQLLPTYEIDGRVGSAGVGVCFDAYLSNSTCLENNFVELSGVSRDAFCVLFDQFELTQYFNDTCP